MYPHMSALFENRIPAGLFHPEDDMIYQPKLDGIFFKLNPKSMVGYTKDGKEYEFKRIMKYHAQKMIPFCYHLNCIRYFIGELCFTDPITGQITRDRHKVMDFLRDHQHAEDYAPYIVFVIFDVILEPEYVKFHKGYDPSKDINRNSTLPTSFNNTLRGKVPSGPSSEVPTTYEEVFKFFVQDNIQLLKNSFVRCMETIPTPYYKAAEVEAYLRKKYGDLEGFVLRRARSIHPSYFKDRFRKMHPDWFKLKPVYDVTLECIAIKAHSKNPDLVGALILKTSDKQLVISAGSGLTKELRNRKDLVGKLFEIEFENLIIKSKLFVNPRIKYIREDVSEADSYEKLLQRIRR